MLARLILKLLPWALVVLLGLGLYLALTRNTNLDLPAQVTNTTILESVEAMGKIELVRYNFQEVTELEKLSPEFFRIFKVGPDSRAVLISRGEAVGCIDLTKLTEKDIRQSADTIFLTLPEPELCYYKLDLENTRMYLLETGFFVNRNKFIEEAYQNAEKQIREAALNSGILEQTKANAGLILAPIFRELTEKTVVIRYDPGDIEIDRE